MHSNTRQRCLRHLNDWSRQSLHTLDIDSLHSKFYKISGELGKRFSVIREQKRNAYFVICGLKHRKSQAGHAAKLSLDMC